MAYLAYAAIYTGVLTWIGLLGIGFIVLFDQIFEWLTRDMEVRRAFIRWYVNEKRQKDTAQ
jgi:hypothetical protein